MKRFLKFILALIIIAVLVCGGYLGYVYFSYDRIADNQALEITGGGAGAAATGVKYDILSYNIGFGAYSLDYSFFMDGGSESRARSENECMENIAGALSVVADKDADFIMLQEVDVDADRSFSINQVAIATEGFSDYDAAFAVNYDSAYLFYPILKPIGASKSGILTLSKHDLPSSVRRSLPIEGGFRKLIDLDRCYSVSRVPVENGRELVLVNLHLTAYAADGAIVKEQVTMLSEDIGREYAAGNYVVCAGDFNLSLLPPLLSLSQVPEPDSWAMPFDESLLPRGFKLVSPSYNEKKAATCRHAGEPYNPGVTETYVIDGFIVSPNVIASRAEVIDTGFIYSDHNPVIMEFELIDE